MEERVAFVLFSGPEMPCKLQDAVLFARDWGQRGGEAKIVFEGNSPQRLLHLPNPEHKLASLYRLVKEEGLIAGVCKACARLNDALEATQAEGLPLLSDAQGHASVALLVRQGYRIITL